MSELKLYAMFMFSHDVWMVSNAGPRVKIPRKLPVAIVKKVFHWEKMADNKVTEYPSAESKFCLTLSPKIFHKLFLNFTFGF
jgi:hypothetical protein